MRSDFQDFLSVSNSLISGVFCEIGYVSLCSAQFESCHRKFDGDEGSPWSIVVRYQNVCHNIKIRCNNSSALALAFLRLLRFSLRLAFLGLTLRLALSFRWRAAVLLGPFPLLTKK